LKNLSFKNSNIQKTIPNAVSEKIFSLLFGF